MTMKPKARKYRMRHPLKDPAQPDGGANDVPQEPAKTRLHTAKQDKAQPDASKKPGNSGLSQTDEIDAIRREGLTGRQLRLARRLAEKHGLPAVSDFDAVRLLRNQGIDPFQRANMLELIVSSDGQDKNSLAKGDARKHPHQLPSTESVSTAERRAIEVAKIQKELAQRRRKKGMLLLLRMAIFILLPTVIAGYYYYNIATPMYSTKSSLVIEMGDGGSASPSLFGASSPLATQRDSITVQEFLQSKDALLKLDEDVGFKDVYSQDWIDPIQRLDKDASIEETFKSYQRHVKISYDPTEGVLKMEVLAPDPEIAKVYSEALIGYAEERADTISLRKRTSSVADAEASLEEAEIERRNAQEDLLRLQLEANIADPTAKLSALRGQISNREVELQEKELQLQSFLSNARPNQARVDATRADIARLEELLETLNAEMLEASTGENSLAEKSLRIQMAEADLAMRDLMMQEALSRLSTAQRDADAQSRYLEQGVRPVASEEPAYPRKFENTILAFLIFGGIYLLTSLTASVLREQIAS